MAYIRMIIGVLIAIGVLAVMPAGVQAQSDDGLVAEWHFDEGEGNVVEDSSGNGNDGVIYGATWVEGKYGGALQFDGVDDYVNCGTSSTLHVDSFTLESWVKWNGATDSDHDIIFNKEKEYEWCIGDKGHAAPTGHIAWAIMTAGTWEWYDTEYTMPLSEWIHIVLSYDQTTIKLYINGVLKSTIEDPNGGAISDSSLPLWIGRRQGVRGHGGEFNGIIDEVRIYNHALNAEKIETHFEQGPIALSLTKSASSSSIKQGKTTTITLAVKNTGSTEIYDVEVADIITSDLIFIEGETSKTYDFLKPKDSREFQYVLQFDEAGTYNLDPVTAMYANENGDYHTIESKPISIDVKSSIIPTSTYQSSKISSSNAQSTSVHLHGEKTDVIMGEDILLKLAAVNLITKPTMHVQVIITPPSGISVTSSEFVQSGAGLFTASYEIEPGVGRDIEVKMRSNQVGDFVVNGRIVYYFGDDMDDAEDHTLTLPITVRSEANAGAGAEQTTGTSGSDGSSTPGFAAVVAVIGLLTVYLRRKIA